MKIMTIVGTRPEIIRLSRVVSALDRHADHCLVHTGQNYDYELNQVFFEDLELRRPDHFLEAVGKTGQEALTTPSVERRLTDFAVDTDVVVAGDEGADLVVELRQR